MYIGKKSWKKNIPLLIVLKAKLHNYIYQLTKNSPDEIVAQIKELMTEFNSIYNVKQKCLILA